MSEPRCPACKPILIREEEYIMEHIMECDNCKISDDVSNDGAPTPRATPPDAEITRSVSEELGAGILDAEDMNQAYQPTMMEPNWDGDDGGLKVILEGFNPDIVPFNLFSQTELPNSNHDDPNTGLPTDLYFFDDEVNIAGNNLGGAVEPADQLHGHAGFGSSIPYLPDQQSAMHHPLPCSNLQLGLSLEEHHKLSYDVAQPSFHQQLSAGASWTYATPQAAQHERLDTHTPGYYAYPGTIDNPQNISAMPSWSYGTPAAPPYQQHQDTDHKEEESYNEPSNSNQRPRKHGMGRKGQQNRRLHAQGLCIWCKQPNPALEKMGCPACLPRRADSTRRYREKLARQSEEREVLLEEEEEALAHHVGGVGQGGVQGAGLLQWERDAEGEEIWEGY
ncbi:hypothetical protein C8A00DRAFT_31413 [Chaetomidium leptoderma]|uniref:Uncharacterized protein n=1 Tax=Chaetomidium leptoderma TaxID=669021 RepID=A0AAN6ZZC6_9PEZI|nr:hypothetical protein C8A00DRAFT_31413 [Chaetomidium leptoderma]